MMQFINFSSVHLSNSTDELVFINRGLASRTPIIIIASSYAVSHNDLKIFIIQIFYQKAVHACFYDCQLEI